MPPCSLGFYLGVLFDIFRSRVTHTRTLSQDLFFLVLLSTHGRHLLLGCALLQLASYHKELETQQAARDQVVRLTQA